MDNKKIHLKLLISLLSVPFLCNAQGAYNNGQLYVGKVNNPGTLYIGGNFSQNGNNVAIIQEGNTLLTGDFINNVTSGNVFTNTNQKKGTVIFAGPQIQYIKGNANKAAHYVDFPNLRVENSNSVRIASTMGANVDTLDLTKGRLVLLSDSTELRKSALAHLLIKNDVRYNRTALNREDKGIVEVDLAMGNNYLGNELSGTHNGLLVGFSSPFKRIYSDYFLFNFLSKPSPTGIFGDDGKLITNPDVEMKAGEGYIIGQDIISDPNYYRQHLAQNKPWSNALFEERATRQYVFARNFLPLSFRFFTDAQYFDNEELNIKDVEVSMNRQGFNYVGNPYTSPIDMSSFVQETATPDNWGVSRNSNPASTADMRNSYYVMSGGTGSYDPSTSKFTFKTSFLLGQQVGSTIDGNIIPPMQMFVVGKNFNTPTTFKIPASARTHGISFFLRNDPEIVDEILLESVDEDSKAFDRLCIVFRDNASLSGDDPYDASKIFNNSGGVSQIYTKTAENKNMTTNVISPQTSSLPLYLNPSAEKKSVTLNASRLESLHSVQHLYLEDKKEGKTVDLLNYPSYTFVTNPGDLSDRFLLYFTQKTISSINDITVTENLQVSYSDGTLRVNGLTANEKGSNLILFNTQGINLLSKVIDQAPTSEIPVSLSPGIYIVKISGKNNYTSKILVK